MTDKTMTFRIGDDHEDVMKETLTEVFDALQEKGYNPINQIVGYILTEDPTYITTHNNARSLIRRLDRDELLAAMVSPISIKIKGGLSLAESKKEKILEYKGKPLVRCGKTIYYGSMSDPYVICLNILNDEDIKGLKVSGKVAIQLIDTDPSVTSPKEKIIKKSEKQGLFNALDLGAVWLERALKKQ